MLTRVFLAAGVAALAIAAPASAERGGQGGGKDRQAASVKQSGGGQRAQAVERRSTAKAQRVQRVQRAERGSGMRFAALQRQERPARAEAKSERRVEARGERVKRADRIERAQTRAADRRELRVQRVDRVDRAEIRAADRQKLRVERVDNRLARRELRGDGIGALSQGVGVGVGGCPPGLLNKDCTPPGLALNANRIGGLEVLRARRLAALTLSPRLRVLDPIQAVRFVGQPISVVNRTVSLASVPLALRPLYLDDDDFYWRYGGGYMYRVDRDDNLVSSLIPLLLGGLMPGQIMPTSYMNSYVPNYYGFNSFYPDSPYDCHRYVNGIIYEVDCVTGLIEDAVPLYAGGYGLGQMLPAGYGYYNVPNQYRSLYYNTPDYNYWYAPGAIYQYDPSSSLITSIASLLTPGFSLGQPLPMGYSAYNVPYAYRTTYYDTPNAWYRYNNGNIYQVDPTTLLVTAIVASILT